MIFEGMNESRLVGSEHEWDGGTEKARNYVDQYNQLFVDTIRSSGGQNETRYLLISTYAASLYPEVLEDLKIPDDDRIGVSLHMYLPFEFAHEPKTTDAWSSENDADTEVIDLALTNIEQALLLEGVPVVITEYGAINKGDDTNRIAWAQYTTEQFSSRGISAFWWDNGVAQDADTYETFALIDRHSLAWAYPELRDVIVAAWE